MGDGTNRQRLDRLAARQLGLFTRAQASACGYSPYQVRRRLAAGEWRQVAGPVCVEGRRLPSRAVRTAAAHLAVPGSVLAGPSAARWYGMALSEPTIFLWTPPGSRPKLPGVRVFRDPLAPHDIRRADGILITSPARTVFD
jgi:hypothetical protein